MAGSRTRSQELKDFASFPLRAFTLFGGRDRWGLTSLANERFTEVRKEVHGECLDVGCGPRNRFVTEILGGRGRGIDVFPYEGLGPDELLEDPRSFPFEDGSFGTVTFVASLNHVPADLRDPELAEAFRCLRAGGRVVVTMGNPVAELVVHRVLALYDRVLGTSYDVDSQRGMEPGEAYFLRDSEIRERLARAGFVDVRKRRFWTQWGLNHLLAGRKPDSQRTRNQST